MLSSSPAIGVVTVDDQAVFRAAARELIQGTPGFTALGEAASGEEATALVRELEPALVLVDLRMPDVDGVETARRLRAACPDAVVVLISLDEPGDVSATLARCGAAGFVRKQDLRPASLRALWAARGGPGRSA